MYHIRCSIFFLCGLYNDSKMGAFDTGKESNKYTSSKIINNKLFASASFFFAIRSNFNKLKTPDQWLWTCRQRCVHKKDSRCIGVVLIKIEMNVSGSSRKDRDSLSPKLVEYLRYSLYIIPELFRE